MKAELIKIGNSQGLRIPKTIIEQCGLTKTVCLTVKDDCLIISSNRPVRSGWKQAFEKMAKCGHDELNLPSFPNEWDEENWVW